MAHQQGVVFQRFTEAETRIQNQTLPRNPGRHTHFDAAVQISRHFRHHIVIARIILHRLRQALHMHQADADRGMLRQQFGRAFVFQRLHIVDDVGPAIFQQAAHNGRPPCIDAERDIPSNQFGQYCGQTPPFLFRRHKIRPRARGLSAQIQNIGALPQQRFGMAQCILPVRGISPAV